MMQQVHLRINDAATGKPTPVRLRITDAEGTYYAPYGRLTEFATGVNQDVGGNVQIGAKKWAYIDGTCEILLPPGALHIEVAKGPEYKPIDETITLIAGKMAMRFTIERWSDVRKQGWYSGDTRVHFLSPDAALLEGQAEDVAVVNLSAKETEIRDSFGKKQRSIPNILSFSGQEFANQTEGCGVAVGTRNQRTGLSGITMGLDLLHCHRIVFPLTLDADDDRWTAEDWCDQCHRKKGLVITDDIGHLAVDGRIDYRTWEMLACMILGKIDAMEVPLGTVTSWAKLSPYNHLFGWYYQLFDAEILFPVVGASFKNGNKWEIGLLRTYAFIPPDQEFSYSRWIDAVRAGRTYASSGPLMDFTINGEVPGRTCSVSADSRSLHINAKARSGVEYHLLELVWNGKVIRAVKAEPIFPFCAELNHELDVTESGWLALRCTSDPDRGPLALGTSAHTSPVAVRLEGSPHWARSDVISSLLAELDDVIAQTRTGTPPRPRLIHLYEAARTVLAKKLSP